MFVKTVEETSLFPLIAEVIIDSKKKKKHEKLHLRAKRRSKWYVSASEDEEEEEIDKYDIFLTRSGIDCSENDEPHPDRLNEPDTEESENEDSSKRNPAECLRRKRVEEVKTVDGAVKKRKVSPKNEEKKHEPIQMGDKKENETKEMKKKEFTIFNSNNADIDLFHSSPNNVVARKIKVSTNLMVTCRMIDQTESKGNISYDYAAMTFQRENANKQMFEIVMPLGLAPRIITAMKIIMDENKKFFKPQDFVETKRTQASTGLRHFSRL